jgi:hypothetical protein
MVEVTVWLADVNDFGCFVRCMLALVVCKFPGGSLFLCIPGRCSHVSDFCFLIVVTGLSTPVYALTTCLEKLALRLVCGLCVACFGQSPMQKTTLQHTRLPNRETGSFAGAPLMHPWAAAVTGSIGGIFYVLTSELMLKYKLDDVVNAVAIHMAPGLWSVVAIGIFGRPDNIRHAYSVAECVLH